MCANVSINEGLWSWEIIRLRQSKFSIRRTFNMSHLCVAFFLIFINTARPLYFIYYCICGVIHVIILIIVFILMFNMRIPLYIFLLIDLCVLLERSS